jgi:hypothetical protein
MTGGERRRLVVSRARHSLKSARASGGGRAAGGALLASNVVSAFAKRHCRARGEACDARRAARPSDPPHGYRQAAAPGTGVAGVE